MTRTGTRRARAAVDAGNSTGVATAVLALLSASALATLGLVSAGEITGGLERLGPGPAGSPVTPPGKVVVAGKEAGGSTERSPGGGTGPGSGSGTGSGGGAGPTIVPPLPADITNDLPTPSGLAGTPVPTPMPGPAAQPGPGPEVVAPRPAPTADPGVRVLAVHGRSAGAPGHTKVDRPRRSSAAGRGQAVGVADSELPGGPELLAKAAVEEPADDQPADREPTAKRPAPPQAAPTTAADRSATASGRVAERAGKPGRSHRPAGGTAHPVPVVPTPAAALVTGPPAGDPPGLAKGRADR